MIGTSRNFRWRRIRPAALQKTRVARAATEEARLIAISGELGLRHAAELAHRPSEGRGPVELYPARRQASLRREVISYVASIVVAALILATILLFVVPGALRG